MRVHIEKRLTAEEELSLVKIELKEKEKELGEIKTRLEAAEEALLTLMFGGRDSV